VLFEWKDEYSVNLITFDDHHRRLVKLINELHTAMSEKRGQTVVGNILKNLIEYTKYHFSEEERLMKKYNYKDYTEHKAEHDAFIKKINDMHERAAKNDSFVTIELRSFLKDWILKHILVSDKNYSKFFTDMGLT